MIGNTMRKDMKEGRFPLPIQSMAIMMNEATGVALITVTAGFMSVSAGLAEYDSAAQSTPAAAPANVPAVIRSSDLNVVSQKSPSPSRERRRPKVSAGDGSIRLLPAPYAAAAQTAIQKIAEDAAAAVLIRILRALPA